MSPVAKRTLEMLAAASLLAGSLPAQIHRVSDEVRTPAFRRMKVSSPFRSNKILFPAYRFVSWSRGEGAGPRVHRPELFTELRIVPHHAVRDLGRVGSLVFGITPQHLFVHPVGTSRFRSWSHFNRLMYGGVSPSGTVALCRSDNRVFSVPLALVAASCQAFFEPPHPGAADR